MRVALEQGKKLVACVASGTSRASKFVLVAKPWEGLVKSRVEFPPAQIRRVF